MISNWRNGPIADFASLVSTGPFGSVLHKADYVDDGFPLVNPINIVGDHIKPDPKKLIPNATRERLANYILRKGDVVVARRGEIGRCAVIGAREAGWICGTGCFFIRPLETLDSDFLAKLLRSPIYHEKLENSARGATMLNLSNSALARLEISVPPLAEQRRIVARIEALFARTRRARADLERIEPFAKRYIEQSRRRAFDEDATWPTASLTGKFPNYMPPGRFDELRSLPSGWRWAEMSTLGEIVGGITKNQKRSNQPLRMPYLRVANVYADELRLHDVSTIQVTEAELERVRLQRGDLLVVEGNGSVEQIGRVSIWDGSIENCGHQNHLIRVRPIAGVPSRFLLHWLMSPGGRSILETVASSSSGLHTLSLSKVAAVPVPVAPTVVADAVVESLDRGLHVARALQADTTRALSLLDRLEQSILARAFRGELLSQDRSEAADVVIAPEARPPGRARRSRAA